MTRKLLDDLVELVKTRSLQFGEFTLSSGEISDYYIDCRKTTMSAQGLSLIGRLGLQRIRDLGWVADAVGGLTLGADPVAYAIAVASCADPPIVEAFTVRKGQKEHGTRATIEGCIPARGPVVVVEDVITTGGSALRAIEEITKHGNPVAGVLAVVDRDAGGSAAIAARGYQCQTLVSLADLGIKRR